ncbi:hypothetical protein SBP02_11990 [Pseudomonas benzenivorans]|uniref:Uncharacterized protein n=1 Tax=Pseudomonas benzenivorans TaxID=556533 RepID=A0ABZ0PRT9_9PSED|nr:hypothetical protein [Pseudomonas benzenivorans]WPC03506.1 hypothetical protein SBP02_11990 [Pseudomonas benzenivorans]
MIRPKFVKQELEILDGYPELKAEKQRLREMYINNIESMPTEAYIKAATELNERLKGIGAPSVGLALKW